MPVWEHFMILKTSILPAESDVYRTAILIPEGCEYEGYYFLHPTKLVEKCDGGLVRLAYHDNFVFELIKKDREKGKRYKRFKLKAKDLLPLFEPSVSPILDKINKKEQEKQAREAAREQKRLARIGTVEVFENDDFKKEIVFNCEEQLFDEYGWKARKPAVVRRHQVLAENVTCQVFEAGRKEFKELCEDYTICRNVMVSASWRMKDRPRVPTEIKDFYNSLCSMVDDLDKVFYQKATEIIERHRENNEI